MKKILPLIFLLPTLAFSAPKFWVGYNLKSDQAPSGTLMNDRQYSNEVEVGVNLTKNFYMENKVTIYPHGHPGYSAHYGAEDSAGYLRPYGEVGYDSHDNRLHYLVGTKVNLNKRFVPFVEINDFLAKDSGNVTMGATLLMMKGFHLKASYAVVRQGQENTFTVGAFYQF